MEDVALVPSRKGWEGLKMRKIWGAEKCNYTNS